MSKESMTKIIKGIRMTIGKRSPEILTGIGIAGMITTTVLAVKATPKALMLIEDAQYEKGDSLTASEKVKTAWKPYIPSVVTGVASITCLIGASSVNAKRNAALATAYELSKTALTEYKEKVVEEIGEKKEKVIREKINQDHLDKNPVSKSNVVITNNGEQLFYDGVSGRYFKSDIETIKAAINKVNRDMVYSNYISLSEFYDELEIEHTSVSDDLGWNLDNGLIEIDFNSRITDDGRSCITLEYAVAPRYDFSKLM
jgi:hypothetical protein